MARPEPRIFEVIHSVRVTPNMHRISLGGVGMKGFPQNQDGGYVKFMLGNGGARKPIIRTYTIRRQTAEGLDIDFALHGSNQDSGPATKWAINANSGDKISVGGPGPAKPLPKGKGHFLLIGDMTALPAISVNLENLPGDATGHVIVLIRNAADKQNLVMPTNMTIEWITESDLGANPNLLADAARGLPMIAKFSYAWVACEFEAMKLLRHFLRIEHEFGKDRLYISSYWKRGLIEDDHKQIKRADAQAVD